MKKLHAFKPIMWCSNAKQIDSWHQENTSRLTGHVISSQDGKNMYLWGAVHGINNHCYSISRLILSLSTMRKTRKVVSTMHNSCHVKVLYWVLFCLCFLVCVGIRSCSIFRENSSWVYFAAISKGSFSSKINEIFESKESKSTKYCDVCFQWPSRLCALELPGCLRWLTFNLGSLVKHTFFI